MKSRNLAVRLAVVVSSAFALAAVGPALGTAKGLERCVRREDHRCEHFVARLLRPEPSSAWA